MNPTLRYVLLWIAVGGLLGVSGIFENMSNWQALSFLAAMSIISDLHDPT